MKLIKGLGLLSFLAVISGSCFDPPEFPATPQIEYEDLRFIPARQPGEMDSLILHINFKDGNGDLGFYGEDDINDPFHDVFFYQETGTPEAPKIEPLGTIFGIPFPGEREYHLLEIADPSKGTLVTHRTRQKPGYSSLLPAPESCPGSNNKYMKNYEYLGGAPLPDQPADGRWLLIRAEDKAALDPKTKLVDSLPKTKPEYYQIRDSLYYTPNPDHNNIEVQFYVKDPTAPGGFKLFDWRDELCTTFDGRFPVFSEDRSSIDGTLTYAMTSFGFRTLFSIKTLKLRFRIKDRARNPSNWEETPEFRL
jgi:hypothetical protein